MERRLSVAIGIIGVAGAVLWVGLAGRKTTPTRPSDAVVADFDMALRETAAGAQARAVTLAQLPRVGWAVATDEATVRDLTADELAFRPQAGEHIEIAQVERVERRVRRLIRIPDDARPALTVSAPGLSLTPDGDRVHVVAVVAIEPRDRGQVVGGLMSVAQVLDTSQTGARLKALGVAARLETPRGVVVLSELPPPPNAIETRRALRSPVGVGATLVMWSPTGGIAWGHVVGALLLLAGCVGSAVGLARRSAAGPATSSAPAPRKAPDLQTPASHRAPEVPPMAEDDPADGAFGVDEPTTAVGPAAATVAAADAEGPAREGGGLETLPPLPGSPPRLPRPSVRLPLPGSEAGAVPAPLPPPPGVPRTVEADGGEVPRLRPLEMSGPVSTRGRAVTVPSSLFVTGGGAAEPAGEARMRASDNPWTPEYRKLFTEFVKLRRTCGESTEDLNRDRFVEALQQKRVELVERHGATEVKFHLAFDNGKAAVRFKAIT